MYNFGRAFYFSSQERILFEQLLLDGHRPATAVFLDGLNDFYFASGQPQFTAEYLRFMERQAGLPADPPFRSSLAAAARQLPLTRAAARWGLISPAQTTPFSGEGPAATGTDAERVQSVLSRWKGNRALIRSAARRRGRSVSPSCGNQYRHTAMSSRT